MKLPTVAFDLGGKHHIAPQEGCYGCRRKQTAVYHTLHDKHPGNLRHIGTSEGGIEPDGHQPGAMGLESAPVDRCRGLEP